MVRTGERPERCPRCGGSRIVRILWGYTKLDGENNQGVGAGRTVLGLNVRYSRPIRPGEPVPVLLLEKSLLPKWACLDCEPRWLDLHRLTLRQLEAETRKVTAIDQMDFERAAAHQHHQQGVEREQGAELLSLLRELVGEAVIFFP